jgi:6-phosphogluconolactonase (cycloisomerase 2 family)
MKIHPSRGWALVANQNIGTIVVFSIDKSSGQLTHRQEIDGLVAPLCIQLVPACYGASL